MAGIMHFANFFRFMEVGGDGLPALARPVRELARTDGSEVGLPARVGGVRLPEAGAFRGRADDRGDGREGSGAKSVSYRFDFTNQRGEPLAVGRITTVFCRSLGPDDIESLEIPRRHPREAGRRDP